MRKAVRAIIIKNSKLLVMHRNKFGKEYETLPGGNIELGETAEQALARELHDETQFNITNLRLVFIEHCEPPYGHQYIYLADTDGLEPVLRPGSEEDHINKLGKNLYQPMWLPLHDLKRLPFVTGELKNHIIDSLDKGWPETPKEFHSKRD